MLIRLRSIVLLILTALLSQTPLYAKNWDVLNSDTPTNLAQWYGVTDRFQNAGTFDISSPVVIQSFEAFMKLDCVGCLDGDLTLAIYGNGTNIPDTGAELFAKSFTVNKSSAAAGADGAWFGLDNMNLSLNTGTYWSAFEVRSGQAYSGGLPFGSINTMQDRAYRDHFVSTDYMPNDELIYGFGVRASSAADPVVTPEPISSALFLLGGSALWFTRRRKVSRL